VRCPRSDPTWSRSSAHTLGRAELVLDSTHEEIAAEDIGPEDVIALSGDAREQIVRGGHETELLDLGETKGMAA
jgi:hypothetical protein